MNLPKLETPSYSITLPYSKNRVEYRPWLVGEQKMLLLASESQDSNEIVRAVSRMLQICTFEKIDVESLSLPDFEYLFLQLRAKSVGETVDFRLKCSECKLPQSASIDLTSVQTTVPKPVSNRLKLSDNVTLNLTAPKVSDMFGHEKLDRLTGTIVASISSVIGPDGTVHRDDVSIEELVEFINGLNTQHLNGIRDWINSIPTLEHTIKFQCSCGVENSHTLSGIMDFF